MRETHHVEPAQRNPVLGQRFQAEMTFSNDLHLGCRSPDTIPPPTHHGGKDFPAPVRHQFEKTLIHGRYGRMGYGVAVLYVFVTSLHSGALAALLTFSSKVWYPYYQRAGATWNFDAVGDQQLAGLIMWVPAGVIVVVLGIALFAMWLAEAERRVSFTASESLRPDREE